MRLDAEYYISKTLIPPLERIFNLVGANVRSWYDEMPKVQRIEQRELLNIRDISRRQNTATLHSYMRSRLCAVCKLEDTDEGNLHDAY
jgi:DNA polymerase zeta